MSVEIVSADIPEVLHRDLKTGNKKPPIFLGMYGLWKSGGFQKFADDIDGHYIDYRAAYKTANDVRGFGVPDFEERKMTFLPDEDFDFHPTKRNVIHFEEVLNASPMAQKALMQATLDRRVGKLKFPDGTYIGLSSNRLNQRTGVERMLGAFADRVSIYLVRPDFDSYTDYLSKNGKTAEVYAFLMSNPSAAYDFDLKKWDGESNFPTFRSFDRLDELLDSYSSTEEAANDRLFLAHATSKIGPKHGAAFTQFLKLTSKIGDISKMLDEADTCRIPSEPDIKWLIACRLVTLADRNNLDNVLTLSHRLTNPQSSIWKTEPDPSAMQTFVVSSIRRNRKELLRTPQLLDWQQRYANTLVG